MCMADYSERPDVYHAALRRARKVRKCEECRRDITIGEKYESASMVYDGYWSRFSTCQHCTVAMAWLIQNCGGFMHGAVWDDLEEHILEYRRLAFPLSRLSVARRRQWQRFAKDGLMAIPPIPPTLASVGLE